MCGDCGGEKTKRENNVRTQCCRTQVTGGSLGAGGEKQYEKLHPPAVKRNPCIGDYERHMYENQDEDICDKGPKEPHHIPGYAGHVPTLQSRSGGTYGHETHEVLASEGSQKPLSFSRLRGHVCPTPLHEPYHIPGYTGHVPGLQSMVGGNYGRDTHKLLSALQPYPNREENISPHRPQGNDTFWKEGRPQAILDESNRFSQRPHKDFKTANTQTQGVYRKPSEYYEQPQYKYRIADTYAKTADITLVDPSINHESKVVVSTRELDDTQVVRTQNTLEEKVGEHPQVNQPIRNRPMIPGFDTYVDALRGARGQRYEFSHCSPPHRQLQQQMLLPRGPELKSSTGISTDIHQQYQSNQLASDDIPYGFSKYGDQQIPFTNSVLYDFTSNFRRRQSPEWAPATVSREDPASFDPPGEIYNRHMGLLPGYSAHVPGAQFRCGRTFTDDSRDARRALRGDRF